MIVLGIALLGIATIWGVLIVDSLAKTDILPRAKVIWLAASLLSGFVALWAAALLGTAEDQLEQSIKTNELLTQLVAQSGNTEAATTADATPTAEPDVEADTGSADGFQQTIRHRQK